MTKNDPVSLLAAVLPYAGRSIHGEAFAPRAKLEPLVELGILVPTGSITEISCSECDECHAAPIVATDEGWRATCDRIGSEFEPLGDLTAYRVDAEVFARWLLEQVGSNDPVRAVPGFDDLWSLGVVRLPPHRVAIYFTPNLGDRGRVANLVSIIEGRSRSVDVGLITADDAVSPYRVPGSRITIVRLHGIVVFDRSSQLVVDCDELERTVVSVSQIRRAPGAPPHQRVRIVAILDEMAVAGQMLDHSNETCRIIGRKFLTRYGDKAPVKSTIINAIDGWNAKR